MPSTPPLLDKITTAHDIHVVGVAGTEGAAIACWLMKLGHTFTGHDFSTPATFHSSIATAHGGLKSDKKKKICDQLGSMKKNIHFQKTYLKSIEKADLIFVSQNWDAYKANAKLKRIFAKYPERFVTITQLYFQLFAGRILAITGTNGKSTTTRLVADIMNKSRHKIWFTGNDRRNDQMLDRLDKVSKKDWLVIEVSNRQLKWPLGRTPDVGVVLNVTKNHLDEYGGSFAKYKAGKYSLIKDQPPEHIAVLNADNTVTASMITRATGSVLPYSVDKRLTRGVYIDKDTIVYKEHTRANVLKVDKIQVLGRHNLSNILAAIASTRAAGVDWKSIRDAVKKFKGMPQRLEIVTKKRGMTWIDDSVSTSPDSTIAAISSFPQGTVRLIAGGDPKGMTYASFAAACKKYKVIEVVLIHSPAGTAMAHELRKRGASYVTVPTFAQAVQQTAAAAKRGEIALFSPTAAWFIYHLQHKIPGGGKGYAELIKKYG